MTERYGDLTVTVIPTFRIQERRPAIVEYMDFPVLYFMAEFFPILVEFVP